MDRLPTAEECLSRAQECRAMSESASNDELRQEYLRVARALTEFAAALDMDKSAPRAAKAIRRLH